MSDVTSKPILFSGPMVRAILDGRKTQTRRIVNPRYDFVVDDSKDGTNRVYYPCYVTGEPEPEEVPCPYGRVGERLWVREAWCRDPHGWLLYRADYDKETLKNAYRKWRPSIHMPRWASRITLEITGKRIERLNDISRGDAISEGCPFPNMAKGDDHRKWFEDLWESINGAGSWAANPWVWVIEFKKVEASHG